MICSGELIFFKQLICSRELIFFKQLICSKELIFFKQLICSGELIFFKQFNLFKRTYLLYTIDLIRRKDFLITTDHRNKTIDLFQKTKLNYSEHKFLTTTKSWSDQNSLFPEIMHLLNALKIRFLCFPVNYLLSTKQSILHYQNVIFVSYKTSKTENKTHA